jgi:hypothetical protein
LGFCTLSAAVDAISVARHGAGEGESPHTDLGVVASRNKVMTVTIRGEAVVGIDCLKVEGAE